MTHRRTALLTAVVLGLAATSAAAAPAAADDDPHARERAALTSTQARLQRERSAVISRLDDRRAALLVARTRRDAAQERYDDAVTAVNRRLSDLYRQPPVGAVGQVLLGDLHDVRARLDLERATERQDQQTVKRLRRAYVALRVAQQNVTARRADLAAEVVRVDVDLGAIEARLLKIPKPKPTFTALTPVTDLGPVYGPYLPGYAPPLAPKPVTRGLSSGVLAGRTLPGAVAVDPTTGRPFVVGSQTGPATSAALGG
jgi:hypothetical protein